MSERARTLLAALLRHRMAQGERSILLDRLSPDHALRAAARSPEGRVELAAPQDSTEAEAAASEEASRVSDPRPHHARQHTAVSSEAIRATTSLPVLSELAAGCPRCTLADSRSRVVFGEGSETADVVVVGEAPGAEEDRTGRPFVGRAGKLLDRLLLSVGFERPDVYICNVLKCRPPRNRNPRAEEIETCSPYLIRQMELLEPRVVLACGTFAAQTLLGTTESIGKLRGNVHRYQGIPLVPTYHPAAVLRNPAWGRLVWEDLQLLRGIADPVTGD